jgi:hypothetical protein
VLLVLYQQQPTLTSNINSNPLSPSISTTTHSPLQYQQLPTLTSNINNNPLSTTNSHLQFQQQQTLLRGLLLILEVRVVVVDIGGESRFLLILKARGGCC